MEELAISNKHAGVRGMPQLEEEEARKVTAAVLAMRGVSQRKQKQAHQERNLKLHRRPMAYKGLSRAWLRNFAKARHEDDWTLKPRLKEERDAETKNAEATWMSGMRAHPRDSEKQAASEGRIRTGDMQEVHTCHEILAVDLQLRRRMASMSCARAWGDNGKCKFEGRIF